MSQQAPDLPQLHQAGEAQANTHDIQVVYLNPSLGTGQGSHYQPTDSVNAPIGPSGWQVIDPRTMVMNP